MGAGRASRTGRFTVSQVGRRRVRSIKLERTFQWSCTYRLGVLGHRTGGGGLAKACTQRRHYPALQ